MPYSDPIRQRAYNREYYNRRAVALRLLKDKPCTDCGYRFHSAAMQFDHLGTDKVARVSKMVLGDWESLLTEVRKCELVCANCHAVRTFTRRQHNPSWRSG